MKKPLLALLLFAAAALYFVFLVAPAPPQLQVQKELRYLMGTEVEVSVAGLPPEKGLAALKAAFDQLLEVDRSMGRRPGSELQNLNDAGSGIVGQPLFSVIETSLEVAAVSNGAFDPTVAPLLDLWKIETGPHPPPSAVEIARTRARTGWQRVRLNRAKLYVDLGGTALDLGAIAKGYGIDRAAGALRELGVADFLINAGGDLYLAGKKNGKSWRVGLQDPRNREKFLRVLAPVEGSIVTSGDYERYFEWEGKRYGHILDPRTALPAEEVQSVTVWAENATLADAYATAVFVLGAKEGLEFIHRKPPAQALVIDKAGVLHETPGFAEVAPETEPR